LSNPESGEKHQTGSIYIRELVATQEFELAENCGVVLCVDRLQGEPREVGQCQSKGACRLLAEAMQGQ